MLMGSKLLSNSPSEAHQGPGTACALWKEVDTEYHLFQKLTDGGETAPAGPGSF